MPHKIEITGYTPAHCGYCPHLDRQRHHCWAYGEHCYGGQYERCPACIANEKAQKEANNADNQTQAEG